MGDNQSQAQLDGFKTRVLRAGAAGVRPAMQRMHVARRGAISGMVLAEQPAFDEPLAPYEVEVQVQAVGLNFRDVLLVLGEYPGPPAPTGTDCAGIVSAAGELAALPATLRRDLFFRASWKDLGLFMRASISSR